MNIENTFTEDELNNYNPNQQERQDMIANLPRKDDGGFDLESMDAEQKAAYWEDKARASSSGFHKFKQEKDREIDIYKKQINPVPANQQPVNNFADEFSDLGIDDEGQIKVLERITEVAEKRAYNKIMNDPSFVGSMSLSKYKALDDAIETLSSQPAYEHIGTYKEAIKAYFPDPMRIPDNILEVLKPIAGSILWEHRDEIANKSAPKNKPVNMPSGQPSENSPKQGRTLEYWTRLLQTDPMALRNPETRKQYEEDMARIKA